MQSHMAALIAYHIDIKDHQILVIYAVFAGKWHNPFDIKSHVKNFHGRAKGGASHHGPLKYATE